MRRAGAGGHELGRTAAGSTGGAQPDTPPGSLADVAPGRTVTLGLPALPLPRARRVAELGLRAGSVVTVLLRTAGGGRVVAVEHARIALDRDTLASLPLLPRGAALAAPVSAT